MSNMSVTGLKIFRQLDKHGHRGDKRPDPIRCPVCKIAGDGSNWTVGVDEDGGVLVIFCRHCYYTVPIVPHGTVSHAAMRVATNEERIKRLEDKLLFVEEEGE